MIPHDKLLALYTSMLKCRLAAQAAGLEIDAGEAVYAASAADLERKDSLLAPPAHALALLARGADAARVITRLRSVSRARKGAADTLVEVIRAARRHKAAKKHAVALAIAGDTETTAASWKRALSTAAQRTLPAIFLSIRTGGEAPAFLGADTIPAEAVAFGVPLITVDGHDAVAVYRVVYESLTRARTLGNPTLIDCLCTRGDSLAVMEAWLRARQLLTPYRKRSIAAAVQTEIAQAANSRSAAS